MKSFQEAYEELAQAWFDVKLQVAMEVLNCWKGITLVCAALVAFVALWGEVEGMQQSLDDLCHELRGPR